MAAYSYAHNHTGNLTNETATINGTLQSIDRRFDEYQRLSTLSVNGNRVDYSYNSQGRLAAVSNGFFVVEYLYTPDGYDAGYSLTADAGLNLIREVERDTYRRQLVTAITNYVNETQFNPLNYSYDFLNRVTQRNDDTFGYNARSEVVAANIQPAHTNSYDFDEIGNNITVELNDTTTSYTANQLNQYTEILRGFASSCELEYDLDGNLTNDGTFTYAWDAENRLIAAYSGSTLVISNAYDHQSRRVLKVTPDETHTFLYDGWNLVQETIATTSSVATNHYIWGKDLSGTLQGAGGVGGLVAVIQGRDGSPGRPFFPLYDNNGNITAYVDDVGSIVAEYRYDAFGNTISKSGILADAFPHRFSTKYFDAETGLYYYGHRFYSPDLMRWLNRDPIEEKGGVNIYSYCGNKVISSYDRLGLSDISQESETLVAVQFYFVGG